MIELNQDLRNAGDFGAPTNRPPLSIHRKLNLHAKRLATLKKCSIEEALAHIINNGIKSIACELEEDPESGYPADLSPRQISVLQGLRDGLAVKEIADKLNIGEATVRTHIIRIRERTGCMDILKLRIP
jgi:DNA-binding NarL/FixJ family response regulator